MLKLHNSAVAGTALCSPRTWLCPLHTATVETFPKAHCPQCVCSWGHGWALCFYREAAETLGRRIQAEGGQSGLPRQQRPRPTYGKAWRTRSGTNKANMGNIPQPLTHRIVSLHFAKVEAGTVRKRETNTASGIIDLLPSLK